MHYYIDGYNLLFRIINAGENLQEPRQRIIQDLSKKIIALNINATLVFDSQYETSPHSFTRIKNFEVHFTDHGETADEYILEDLKKLADPEKTVVVTSDKKLAWQARRYLAKTESIEEFVGWLNRRYKNRLKKLKALHNAPIKTNVPEKKIALKVSSSSQSKPSSDVSPEECLNYYLEQFESMDQAALAQAKPKEPAQPPKKAKKKKKLPKKNEDAISVLNLWMTAFERNLEEDLQDPWKD